MTVRICGFCGEPTGRDSRAIRCMPCMNLADRIKSRAHYAVAAAIRSGSLQRASEVSCEDCGKQAQEYDHRDYSRRLSVSPVCHSCNLLRGPGLFTGLVPEKVAAQ